MTPILRTLDLLRAETITGEETRIIDAALSTAKVHQIPGSFTSDVLSYVDSQLLCNPVSQDVKDGLCRLQAELRLRAG